MHSVVSESVRDIGHAYRHTAWAIVNTDGDAGDKFAAREKWAAAVQKWMYESGANPSRDAVERKCDALIEQVNANIRFPFWLNIVARLLTWRLAYTHFPGFQRAYDLAQQRTEDEIIRLCSTDKTQN